MSPIAGFLLYLDSIVRQEPAAPLSSVVLVCRYEQFLHLLTAQTASMIFSLSRASRACSGPTFLAARKCFRALRDSRNKSRGLVK